MDAVANMVQQGQPTASGTSIGVEKHKINFERQYGTFEDKMSQNIVRWLRKADKYQNAHMIPSLEMAAIIIHCIRGEPAIKVKRWLDVPGLNYIHADHYNAQPLQPAQEYEPYQELQEAVEFQAAVQAAPEVAHVPAVLADPNAVPPVLAQEEIPFQPAVAAQPQIDAAPRRPARPAILPRRYQPLVLANQCLRHYLARVYQKRINLSDADKFLTTFKLQKPRQTCSNFLDEFIIHYENYAHMKWSIEEIDGIEAVQEVIANPNANPPVVGVAAVEGMEGNHELRNAEMIQLATDGLCKEFKVHCDNTAINLRTITFPELEIQVENWQRNTETGKTFTAACTPANIGKYANVSALEMSDYFDTDRNVPDLLRVNMDQAQVSVSNTGNRGRGIRGARGYGRGGRGFRGRGQGRGRIIPRPSIQSKDSQDGGFNNYRQTQDGTLMISPQGHPLCNYCGIPSHKRELCRIKKADREAGLTRTIHPDRDNPKTRPIRTPLKSTAQATVSAATYPNPWTGYPNYPMVPFNYHNPNYPHPNYPIVPLNYSYPPANEPGHQTQKEPDIQALVHAARLEHEQSAQGQTTFEKSHNPTTETTRPNPCPYPTCSAILPDPQMTQEHIRMFHKQANNLAMKPGNNP